MNRISPLLCVPLLAACGVAGAQDATAPATPILPANAVDAHAAAAAIESCNAKMQTLLAALDRHDYAGAETDFDDTMRAGLSPDQLQQAWESLPQKFGAPGLARRRRTTAPAMVTPSSPCRCHSRTHRWRRRSPAARTARSRAST